MGKDSVIVAIKKRKRSSLIEFFGNDPQTSSDEVFKGKTDGEVVLVHIGDVGAYGKACLHVVIDQAPDARMPIENTFFRVKRDLPPAFVDHIASH